MEVVKSVARNIKIMFWHDPKRTDGGQCTAVFAVKLVDSVAVNDQFPLVAARQVEVAHQAIPSIVFIPVARVVHARPIVAAIPLVVIAGITHGASDTTPFVACVPLFGLSVKTPWQLLRGVVRGMRRSAGRFAAAFRAWS